MLAVTNFVDAYILEIGLRFSRRISAGCRAWRRGAEAQRRAIAWRSIGTNRRNPHAVAVAVARLAGLALAGLALAGLSLSVYCRA